MRKQAYPYDRDDFDAGLAAVLGHLRRAPLMDYEEGEERPASLIRDDMPDEVRALLHTMDLHGCYADLGMVYGGYELRGLARLSAHGQSAVIAAALAPHEVAPTDAMLIGATGGGEDNLLLTWKGDAYQVFVWQVQEGKLSAPQSLTSFLTALRDDVVYNYEDRNEEDEDPFPEDFQAVLVAMGTWTELASRDADDNSDSDDDMEEGDDASDEG